MKTAIILHGMPSREEYFNLESAAQSNKHWLPWIQRQLILKGILAQTPELPEPYEPNYKKWCSVFEQFHIDEETILIGHSCGAGFLVRWLSENKVKVGKVALVAPWVNPATKKTSPGFFEFKIDSDMVERTKGLGLFISNDDDSEIQESIKLLKKTIQGVDLQELTSKGHFTMRDMKTDQFPELRDWLLK